MSESYAKTSTSLEPARRAGPRLDALRHAAGRAALACAAALIASASAATAHSPIDITGGAANERAVSNIPRSDIVAQNDKPASRPAPAAPGQTSSAPARDGTLGLAQLKVLVPERIGSWKRQSFRVPVERGRGAPDDGPTFVSEYRQGKERATLTVADMGALSAAAAPAQWAGEPTQRETETGTEKVYREGRHTVREVLKRDSHQRELTLILGNGIVVAVTSAQADFAALKKLADGVDIAKAEAIARPLK